MSSKHKGAPWYHSQLRIDSQLPTTFFKATTPSSTAPAVEEPAGTTVSVSAPLISDVPEADTLEFVPDIEEEPLNDPVVEPEPPSTRQGIDIESLTVADLKEITRFLPSDLHQYHYFGGGIGWAVTDKMTLKHASLQLSLHLRTRAPAYSHLKKEKTGSFPKRGNIRCTSSSKNVVGRSGGQKIQRVTPMGVR